MNQTDSIENIKPTISNVENLNVNLKKSPDNSSKKKKIIIIITIVILILLIASVIIYIFVIKGRDKD